MKRAQREADDKRETKKQKATQVELWEKNSVSEAKALTSQIRGTFKKLWGDAAHDRHNNSIVKLWSVEDESKLKEQYKDYWKADRLSLKLMTSTKPRQVDMNLWSEILKLAYWPSVLKKHATHQQPGIIRHVLLKDEFIFFQPSLRVIARTMALYIGLANKRKPKTIEIRVLSRLAVVLCQEDPPKMTKLLQESIENRKEHVIQSTATFGALVEQGSMFPYCIEQVLLKRIGLGDKSKFY